MKAEPHPRNKLTFFDRVNILLVFIPIPIVLSWALIQSFWSKKDRHKSWKRVLVDNISLYMMSNLSRRQGRGLNGRTTASVYGDFMKTQGLPEVVEDLGEDTRLFWLGPRRVDNVILYLHGGAFLYPALASAPFFWHYAQITLGKRGKAIDVAMLNYTLVPEAMFPTQLKQTVLAVQHLIDTGVKPENIQLASDSAGGALVHQVLSHVLHPVKGVPTLTLANPLGGAFMMSPWVCLADSDSIRSNQGKGDLVNIATSIYWGSKVLKDTPEAGLQYLNAVTIPEDWFKGLENVVKRILISAGDAEVIRDAIIKYTKEVENHHKGLYFFLEERGVHCEPLLVFLTKDKDLGKLSPFVVDWLDQGFTS